MATIPERMITSSQGAQPVPTIALGTVMLGATGIEAVTPSTIIEAIKMGYRHFNTAAAYKSEKPIGEAIAVALRLGLIKSRSEIFITTKLWCNSADRHLVVPAIKESLKNLRVEYVDLYLIHLPVKIIHEEIKIPVPSKCIAAIDIKAVWEGMEECQNLGRAKSIGVSKFSAKRIEEILSFAKIPPAVNQVEMHPVWQQKKLNSFCKENGIAVTAYSPLGTSGTSTWGHYRVLECDVLQDISKSKGKTVAQVEMNPVRQQRKLNRFCKENDIVVTAYSPLGTSGISTWGHNRVRGCDVLQDIAKSKGKTVAQISLRWLYEQGVIIAVKSFNTERMKQNLDIFGWSLTEVELNKIDQVPQHMGVYLNKRIVIEHNDVLAEIDAELD